MDLLAAENESEPLMVAIAEVWSASCARKNPTSFSIWSEGLSEMFTVSATGYTGVGSNCDTDAVLSGWAVPGIGWRLGSKPAAYGRPA